MRDEETLFAEAVGKSAGRARADFLDRACGSDARLRRAVEALLAAHDRAGGILERTLPTLAACDAEGAGWERVGSVVGPYKLLEQIGEGGFGVVYMAEQQHPVRRRVALKVIKPGMDSGQVLARFEAERQALALMDHPNIARVFDAGTTAAGRPYFVMELVRGVPVTDYCDQNQLGARQRLELFVQVCHAVQHAHQKGVIHRDIKPGNVLVTLHDGRPVPKVIDFGIAKAMGQRLTEKTLFTNFAQMVGTPLYMSPEQAELSGLDVDTRSDVYCLGVLLYELLTGTTPFDKERLKRAAYDEVRRIIREEDPPKPSTRISTMGEAVTAVSARRKTDPKRLGQLVRGELDWIVMKALEKDRTRRYETANWLAADVERYLADEPVAACPPTVAYRFGKFARRNKAALTTAVLIAAALLGGAVVSTWQALRAGRAESVARAERDRAVTAELRTRMLGRIPAVEALVRDRRYAEAYDLLREVEAVVPDDARLADLRTECSWVLTIETVPPGARVWRKPPGAGGGAWQSLGVTPVREVRLARGTYEWKVEKDGHATAEGLGIECPLGPALSPMGGTVRLTLDPEGVVPEGMVRVRPLAPGLFWGQRNVQVPEFWIDRCEVTNRRFKRFVDAGGYRRPELWARDIERDGKPLTWEQAVALFRDSTGRPGPATWAGGTYPEGADEFPVAGVGWYEADAFARFEGKSLPTIFHWSGASGRVFLAAEIVPRSNIQGSGPAAVGRFPAMTHCGARDMAGNVKEWCWNGAGGGRRYVMGGAWDEKDYTFSIEEVRDGTDRSANIGFRCAAYPPGAAASGDALADVPPVVRDFLAEQPLGDGEFALVAAQFGYDRGLPLGAVVEREETAAWVHERVTLAAAYGGERFDVHLYLPRGAAPKYQPVVYWPGMGACYAAAVPPPTAENVAFLVKGGRALVWPVYKGTFERRRQPPAAALRWEDAVEQYKDLARALDYLETRGEFDTAAVGYYGYSWGAAHAVRCLAVERRIKAAVLVDGGLPAGPFQRPEHDPVHFVPRVTIPVLMLNARYDSAFPPARAQEPMFRLLGTDAARKQYRLSDVAHVSAPTAGRVRLALDWFDQHLGPAAARDGPSPGATGPPGAPLK